MSSIDFINGVIIAIFRKFKKLENNWREKIKRLRLINSE
jgi:hypothetical protein